MHYVGTSDPLNARDIGTPEDIKTLVNVFYEEVNQYEMLAPVFNDVARVTGRRICKPCIASGNRWCWSRAAVKAPPFPKHAVLPVQQTHFERWLTLVAVNENWQKSEEAKGRALCIADTFARRMGVLTDPVGLSEPAFRKTTSTYEMIHQEL